MYWQSGFCKCLHLWRHNVSGLTAFQAVTFIDLPRERVGVIITAFISVKCSEAFVVSLLSFCTSITSPMN